MIHFDEVALASLSYLLPAEVLSSSSIEHQLAGLASKIGLPLGFIGATTGIHHRRFWPRGTVPSECSATVVKNALQAGDIDTSDVDMLVHASVWRDCLEPATATVVHQRLNLARHCLAYDVTNACLGFLNGIVQVAGLIESGSIRCGVVVATEGSRGVIEATMDDLLRPNVTREDLLSSVPSLTIGSGSVAAVLVHKQRKRNVSRVLAAGWGIDSAGVDCCVCPTDAAGPDASALLETNSPRLLRRATRLGAAVLREFEKSVSWQDGGVDKLVTHQVSRTATRLMMNRVGVPEERTPSTYRQLGNTASASVPLTLALAGERKMLADADRTLLMGFGSGINCMLLALKWGESCIHGVDLASGRTSELLSVA